MHELSHYLVRVERPHEGWPALELLSARARESAEWLRSEGTPIRFLRSIFVPEDDSCFFLYEGDSAAAVGEAGRRAALVVERVEAAIELKRTEEG